MSKSFAQDTTFSIEKIVQNAYIDPINQGLPPTYLNSVLGESMSNLVAVNETVGNVTYKKLYVAFVTDISFTSIDTVSGNIAIARFDENLQLEAIFRSSILNTTNGRETNPALIYAEKRLFIAYSTKSSITASSAEYDISKEGTSFDLVVAGLDIFTFNTSSQSEPITGLRDNIEILWIKQNTSFNSATADDGFSNLSDASNQNVAPFLAFDLSNDVLYCAYNQCISGNDFDVKVLAVVNAIGYQTGAGPYIRSYDNTAVISQLLNLPQSAASSAGSLNTSTNINTARKDLYPAISVDISCNLHLIYRTEGTGVYIGSSTKNILINGNTYVYVRMSSPNFENAITESTVLSRNYWTITDISAIGLTTISGNYFSPIDIKYSKGFLYVGASSYDTGSSTSYPVVFKINAHSFPFTIENGVGSAIQSATGSTGPTSVKVITDIKDPSNNDNVILAYHTYPVNGTTHVNLTRYNVSGSAFTFKDFTTSADMSGFDVAGKTTRNPSMVYLNGYLYISAETNAATSYIDLEGVSYTNKYAGTQTISGFYDIALAKINVFKPNRIRDLSLTEGINVVDLTWGPTINATAGGSVNWWPPTNGSSYGYRISYRKTGEDGASFVDISDISYNGTLNSFRVATTTYGGADVGANQKVLEKGYQYEFIVRALLNGSPGDYFTLSGMPVDGYVIASLSGTSSIFLGSTGGRQVLTDISFNNGQIPTGDCSFNSVTGTSINLSLSGGVAYNIAVRSYVLLQNNFANYSLADQSGIVIPRYAAPANITATAGSNCIKVTFQTVSGDNIDGYEIQYSKDGFTTTLKTLYPIKSMAPNTNVTTFLAYNDKDNIDAELPDSGSYAVKIRAVGGKNLTSVNGIALTADADGYRVYGITSASTSPVAPNVIPEPSITISGEKNLFLTTPTNVNIAGYISSQTIWPKWITVGTFSNATLSGCISINGFRFRLPVETLDLSLSTASLANTTLIPASAVISPAGISRTTINPATLYDIKIFLCDAAGDPAGRIISRKVLTAPTQPSLTAVSISAFNATATSTPPNNLPTLTTSWTYNDLSGYPDLAGFKLYYKRPSETSFNIYTVPSSRALTSALVNNIVGGTKFEFFIRAYVTPRRIGEYLIITDASGNTNQPGETASPRFASTLTTPPVNTIVRFLPSNQSATFIFDDSIHNKDYINYTVSISGVGNAFQGNAIYTKTPNSLVIGGLTASTTYAYIITVSGAYRGGYDFTTINFTTASRAAQDISLTSVVAGAQSVILNLTRTVRSASGENLVVSYKQETTTNDVLGSAIFKRFYATDSSQVKLTGLFPKRDISDIQVFVEEFYPETNLFFYSNVYSYNGKFQPTFFAPRAPKLTSATPSLGVTDNGATPYQATITWTPNVNFRA